MPSDKVVVQFRLRSMAKQGSCGPKVAYPVTVHPFARLSSMIVNKTMDLRRERSDQST